MNFPSGVALGFVVCTAAAGTAVLARRAVLRREGSPPPRLKDRPDPARARTQRPRPPPGDLWPPTVSPDPTAYGPALVLFSGGSAFDATVTEVAKLTTRTAYVVPISDNGGSSKEIIRVLGGPAIGDIRSRLIRLSHPRSSEDESVIALLSHRLTGESRDAAKTECLRIVDGTHPMWSGIAEAYKQTVRAFLLHFLLHTLRRESVQELSVDVVNLADELAHFDFRRGSIGNYMITGARIFFGSLEAAIFWFSNLAGIPRASCVVPVINVNSKVTLGVRLRCGQELIGQDNISHPVGLGGGETKDGAHVPLPDAIERVFYVSEYGSEVRPPVNPMVLAHLEGCHGVLYTMGSLYTSILPSLVLKDMGKAIAALECPKILVLNGCADRETTWLTAAGEVEFMKAEDVVRAVCHALNQNEDPPDAHHGPQEYITHVLYLQNSPLVDEEQLRALYNFGLIAMEVPRDDAKAHHYNDRMLVKAMRSCLEGWEVRQMCEIKRRSFSSTPMLGPMGPMPLPSPMQSPKPPPPVPPHRPPPLFATTLAPPAAPPTPSSAPSPLRAVLSL
eukprot:EG_transcript_4434